MQPNDQTPATRRLLARVRLAIGVVILGLVFSGLSAFPLVAESGWLADFLRQQTPLPAAATFMEEIHRGLVATGRSYPFIAYGTDWLAFGHIIIALFFLGPLLDPRRNLWVIDAGLIACVLVLPTALICGGIRGLPLWWRLIDCAFGVFGAIPLALARRWTRRLPV